MIQIHIEKQIKQLFKIYLGPIVEMKSYSHTHKKMPNLGGPGGN